jgi:hypothetical protein
MRATDAFSEPVFVPTAAAGGGFLATQKFHACH